MKKQRDCKTCARISNSPDRCIAECDALELMTEEEIAIYYDQVESGCPYYLEKKLPTKKNCETCANCWEDPSVGARGCRCDELMTEEEIETYCEDMKDGCPHYEERKDIEEDLYYKALIDDVLACTKSCPQWIKCKGR